MNTLNIHYVVDRKGIPNLHPLSSLPGAIINPPRLELSR